LILALILNRPTSAGGGKKQYFVQQLDTLRDAMCVNLFADCPRRERVASRGNGVYLSMHKISKNITPAQRLVTFVDRLMSMVDYFGANLVLLRQDGLPEAVVCVIAVEYGEGDKTRCEALFSSKDHHGSSTQAASFVFPLSQGHKADLYLYNLQSSDMYFRAGSFNNSTVLYNDDMVTLNDTLANVSQHHSDILIAKGFAAVGHRDLLCTTGTCTHVLQDSNDRVILTCTVEADSLS